MTCGHQKKENDFVFQLFFYYFFPCNTGLTETGNQELVKILQCIHSTHSTFFGKTVSPAFALLPRSGQRMAGSSKIEKFCGLAITFAFLGRLRSFLYSFSSTLFGPPAKTQARQFYNTFGPPATGFFRA